MCQPLGGATWNVKVKIKVSRIDPLRTMNGYNTTNSTWKKIKYNPDNWQSCCKKMANVSKNPSLCLINISVDRPLRVVMMSTLIFCWSVEKNTPRVNDPEVRGLIRDVHVSWSQRTPCLSWLPDWPLSVSAVWALFQESLKKHDKIIPRSSPTDVSYMQPSASSAEPCTTLQLHPETANCTIRANWYVPGKKKKKGLWCQF